MLAGDLRVAELNYHPHAPLVQFGEREADPDDFEFVELANAGDASLNLAGYEFSEGISFRFTSQVLDPGERLVVVKNRKDFRSRFGEDVRIALGNDGNGGDAGEFGQSLNNAGETLTLRGPDGQVVQRFTYFDRGEWPVLADGMGSSLEVLDLRGDLNDPKSWRASAEYGGSPGTAGVGFPGEVVINELLTHTDFPQVDTIELFNRTGQTVDMTGWYLTDSVTNIFRYRISGPDAVLAVNDYRVYDEIELGFSFRGQEADNAFLIEANAAGRPLRFVDVVSYGATQNGITLGRWPNGVGELFPMDAPTFEDPNSGPLIGEIVISELQFHPPQPAFGSRLSVDELEFVELHNRTSVPLNIGQWRLREAVDFTFPDETVIPADGTILILGFDPLADPNKTADFVDHYGISGRITFLGPYSDASDPNADQLDDDGERLILERPEDILQLGLGYVLVDRVIYRDHSPWPTEPDGDGPSLTRVNLNGYGDFASTWEARVPSPGMTGTPGDVTGDGVVDASDIDQTCLAANLSGNHPLYDHNRDGFVDGADVEYLITSILQTTVGDANLDGRFDSSDLVQVFAAGEYEDDVALNSGWASGDWNCDREFDSSDLVAAFQAGSYTTAATVAPVATAIWSEALLAAAGSEAVTPKRSAGPDTSRQLPDTSRRAERIDPRRIHAAACLRLIDARRHADRGNHLCPGHRRPGVVRSRRSCTRRRSGRYGGLALDRGDEDSASSIAMADPAQRGGLPGTLDGSAMAACLAARRFAGGILLAREWLGSLPGVARLVEGPVRGAHVCTGLAVAVRRSAATWPALAARAGRDGGSVPFDAPPCLAGGVDLSSCTGPATGDHRGGLRSWGDGVECADVDLGGKRQLLTQPDDRFDLPLAALRALGPEIRARGTDAGLARQPGLGLGVDGPTAGGRGSPAGPFASRSGGNRGPRGGGCRGDCDCLDRRGGGQCEPRAAGGDDRVDLGGGPHAEPGRLRHRLWGRPPDATRPADAAGLDPGDWNAERGAGNGFGERTVPGPSGRLNSYRPVHFRLHVDRDDPGVDLASPSGRRKQFENAISKGLRLLTLGRQKPRLPMSLASNGGAAPLDAVSFYGFGQRGPTR